jgi:hypothetical protein
MKIEIKINVFESGRFQILLDDLMIRMGRDSVTVSSYYTIETIYRKTFVANELRKFLKPFNQFVKAKKHMQRISAKYNESYF